MQEKKKNLGNFYFFTKKKLIFKQFFNFLRPAFGHGRLGYPQSLEYRLTSCSLVVRALVCQPRGPGLNPGGIVQSQLVQGEKPI